MGGLFFVKCVTEGRTFIGDSFFCGGVYNGSVDSKRKCKKGNWWVGGFPSDTYSCASGVFFHWSYWLTGGWWCI